MIVLHVASSPHTQVRVTYNTTCMCYIQHNIPPHVQEGSDRLTFRYLMCPRLSAMDTSQLVYCVWNKNSITAECWLIMTDHDWSVISKLGLLEMSLSKIAHHSEQLVRFDPDSLWCHHITMTSGDRGGRSLWISRCSQTGHDWKHLLSPDQTADWGLINYMMWWVFDYYKNCLILKQLFSNIAKLVKK